MGWRAPGLRACSRGRIGLLLCLLCTSGLLAGVQSSRGEQQRGEAGSVLSQAADGVQEGGFRLQGLLRRLLAKAAPASADIEEDEELGLDEDTGDVGLEADEFDQLEAALMQVDDDADAGGLDEDVPPEEEEEEPEQDGPPLSPVEQFSGSLPVKPAKDDAKERLIMKGSGINDDMPLWDEEDDDEEEEEEPAQKPAAAAAKKGAAAAAAKKPAAAAKKGAVKAPAAAKKGAAAAGKLPGAPGPAPDDGNATEPAKPKKKDIVADTTIIDIPFDPNVLPDDEDGDAANALPAEKDWHKEHLVSTKSCKIYVLDISEMAGLLGYPTCDPARFVTDPEFGTIMPNASMVLPKFNYTPPMQQYESMYPFYALPHYESLNAAPWYVYNTLMNSPRRVEDPNDADIIFVYDYCRLMWALSEDHANHHWWASANLKKKATGTGGPSLVSAYNVMTQMWQWKRSQGKEFVFFQSHPAMTFGNQSVTNEYYQKIICHMMANSLHLVVERTQRWKCPTYREDNLIVTPYSGTEHLVGMVDGITNTTTPKPAERPNLAFFRGNCGPWENVAKRMRHAMVSALRADNVTQVDACCLGEPKLKLLKCSKEEAHGGGTAMGWHRAMLESMTKSRFCMIVPGDTQSSERLADAFVTGCIPVFVGPPFHAMPFVRHVDYGASSIFINLTDTRKWFGKEKAQHHLNPRTKNKHKGKDGDWWHPKWWRADVNGQAVRLRNMEQVVFYLKEMAPEEADEKYANVMRQRNMFIYKKEPSNPPSASDVVIEGMCEYALNGYGQTDLMSFGDTEEVAERDRKRRVKKYKDKKAEEAAF